MQDDAVEAVAQYCTSRSLLLDATRSARKQRESLLDATKQRREQVLSLMQSLGVDCVPVPRTTDDGLSRGDAEARGGSVYVRIRRSGVRASLDDVVSSLAETLRSKGAESVPVLVRETHRLVKRRIDERLREEGKASVFVSSSASRSSSTHPDGSATTTPPPPPPSSLSAWRELTSLSSRLVQSEEALKRDRRLFREETADAREVCKGTEESVVQALLGPEGRARTESIGQREPDEGRGDGSGRGEAAAAVARKRKVRLVRPEGTSTFVLGCRTKTVASAPSLRLLIRSLHTVLEEVLEGRDAAGEQPSSLDEATLVPLVKRRVEEKIALLPTKTKVSIQFARQIATER